jgi:hypothetical protein
MLDLLLELGKRVRKLPRAGEKTTFTCPDEMNLNFDCLHRASAAASVPSKTRQSALLLVTASGRLSSGKTRLSYFLMKKSKPHRLVHRILETSWLSR